MGWLTGILGVASAIGSIAQSNAASKGADAVSDAAAQNNALTEQQFNTAIGLSLPAILGGDQARDLRLAGAGIGPTSQFGGMNALAGAGFGGANVNGSSLAGLYGGSGAPGVGGLTPGSPEYFDQLSGSGLSPSIIGKLTQRAGGQYYDPSVLNTVATGNNPFEDGRFLNPVGSYLNRAWGIRDPFGLINKKKDPDPAGGTLGESFEGLDQRLDFDRYVGDHPGMSAYYDNMSARERDAYMQSWDLNQNGTLERGEFGAGHYYDVAGQNEGRYVPFVDGSGGIGENTDHFADVTQGLQDGTWVRNDDGTITNTQYNAQGGQAYNPNQPAKGTVNTVDADRYTRVMGEAPQAGSAYASTNTGGGSGGGVNPQAGMSPEELQQLAYDRFIGSGFNRAATDVTNNDFDQIKGAYGAGGSVLSGSAAGAMSDRLARNRYGAYVGYDNALAGMSGAAQQAGSQIGSQGLQYAGMAGNNALAGAYAQQSSYGQQAGALNNGLQNLGNIVGYGAGGGFGGGGSSSGGASAGGFGGGFGGNSPWLGGGGWS